MSAPVCASPDDAFAAAVAEGEALGERMTGAMIARCLPHAAASESERAS